MKITALAALTAVVALILVLPALAATPVFKGNDGPGFTITLKQGGKTVKTLKAGKYVFKISDKSNIHDFHLTGPGVNKVTSVTAVKTYTWNVTLKKGTYKFVCDPHPFMKGSFTVK